MVLDIGEPEPGRNAGGAGERAVERRLADAVAASGGKDARRPEGLGIGVVDVRVVADGVAHEEVEPPRGGDRAYRPGRGLPRLGLDRRMIAVDEFGRAEEETQIVHR